MGVEETIRAPLSKPAITKKAWEDYNQRSAAGEKNLIAPRRRLRLETARRSARRQTLRHSHCYREDEI